MKKRLIILSLILLLNFISPISAIPNDFEVSNVYWAAEGTMNNKPILIGLVGLSWDSGKGNSEYLLVYMNYDSKKYYSDSLGLIKSVEDLKIGITEAQFFPLETYANIKLTDKIPSYSLIIPISESGSINFDNILFSKLNKEIIIKENFRTANSDKEEMFAEEDLVSCSKNILFDSSESDKCDSNNMPYEEFNKCRNEAKTKSITFNCNLFCLKKYYKEYFNKQDSILPECSLYNPIFTKKTSESLDFSILTKSNPGLELFNPWRSGP